MTGEAIRREVRSSAELQEVCLRTLKQCPGFEQVNEILIQPRDNAEGSANWTLAAVRPPKPAPTMTIIGAMNQFRFHISSA